MGDISAGGWFSRAIGLTADVSGGTGEYKYYFALYKQEKLFLKKELLTMSYK